MKFRLAFLFLLTPLIFKLSAQFSAPQQNLINDAANESDSFRRHFAVKGDFFAAAFFKNYNLSAEYMFGNYTSVNYRGTFKTALPYFTFTHTLGYRYYFQRDIYFKGPYAQAGIGLWYKYKRVTDHPEWPDEILTHGEEINIGYQFVEPSSGFILDLMIGGGVFHNYQPLIPKDFFLKPYGNMYLSLGFAF